jgi:hypothetical protein
MYAASKLGCRYRNLMRRTILSKQRTQITMSIDHLKS